MNQNKQSELPKPIIVSHHIKRTQLIERLNLLLFSDNSFHRRMTVVYAPAGYGKTALIREWLYREEHSFLTIWSDIQENHIDENQLFFELTAKIKLVEPQFNGRWPVGSLPIQVPNLLNELLNNLSLLPRDIVMVLDNYHNIQNPDIHKHIDFMAEYLPANVHMVLISRETIPISLARLRAHRQVLILSVEDIKFSQSEESEFFKAHFPSGLNPITQQAVSIRMQGWITGLNLAVMAIQHQMVDGIIPEITTAHDEFILDYLQEQVFQSIPLSDQDWLIKLAILDRFSEPLSKFVTQNPTSHRESLLQNLERKNFFLTQIDDSHTWYQFHPVFRQLLIHHLKARYGNEEIHRLYERAAMWYLKTGDELTAQYYLIHAGKFSKATRLAEANWKKAEEEFQTGEWLENVLRIPRDEIMKHSDLMVQIASACMDRGDIEQSEFWLTQVQTTHPQSISGKKRTQQAKIALIQAYNAQAEGNLAAARFHAELVRNLDMTEPHLLAQASAVLAGVCWAEGDLSKAVSHLEEWITYCKSVGLFSFAIASIPSLADILVAQGNLKRADDLLSNTIRSGRYLSDDLRPFHAPVMLGLGLINLEYGDLSQAVQQLELAVDLGKNLPQIDWTYRLFMARARFALAGQNYSTALHWLGEAQKEYVQTPIPNTAPLKAWMARVHLFQGDLQKAWNWASRFRSDALPVSYLREFELLTLSAVWLSQPSPKNAQAACALLEKVEECARRDGRSGSLPEILLLRAQAESSLGNKASAFEFMRIACVYGYQEGYQQSIHQWWMLFPTLQEAFAEMVKLFGDTDPGLIHYVDRIKNHLLAEKINPTGLDLVPDPLTNREMDVLRLIGAGFSNEMICQRLFLALSTVKGYNQRIFAKLQAKNRTQAVANARRSGLL